MSYLGSRGMGDIERGPEMGVEPSWEGMLTEGGTLHRDFSVIARNDFSLGLRLLGGFVKSLPEDRTPRDIEGALDLIDWENPDDRQAFLDQYRSALNETNPES